MIPRRQLPVHSPVSLRGLAGGVAAVLRPPLGPFPDARSGLTTFLGQRYAAQHTLLTDSGTSALVLALRALAGQCGIAALPGYGCVDLTAAAVRAGVRVRLYDLDPRTLGPDMDSLARVVRAGVDVIVVAHLYGMPTDMVEVGTLADAAGVAVIEDAAQAAGAALHGQLLGTFGTATVLSFGRGKGTSGGHGGALLLRHAVDRAPLSHGAPALPAGPGGGRDLLAVAAQWMLGRPGLYAIPSAMPWLRLGEMVYHPAREPHGISRASAAMVQVAIRSGDREVACRRARAVRLRSRLARAPGVEMVHEIPGASPGYLRLPLLGDVHGHIAPDLGVLRGYPQTLREHVPLRSLLLGDRESLVGASELAARLITAPTHSLVSETDERAIVRRFGVDPDAPPAIPDVIRNTFLDEHVTAL